MIKPGDIQEIAYTEHHCRECESKISDGGLWLCSYDCPRDTDDMKSREYTVVRWAGTVTCVSVEEIKPAAPKETEA